MVSVWPTTESAVEYRSDEPHPREFVLRTGNHGMRRLKLGLIFLGHLLPSVRGGSADLRHDIAR